MILDFCLARFAELDRGLTRAALERNRPFLHGRGLPLAAEPLQIQAVLSSNLCRVLADLGPDRVIPTGHRVGLLDAIPGPPPAEYARLISKGRLLYEHCMAEVSSACVIGFIHHELTKSISARRVVLELLGWIVEQRLQLLDLVPEEGDGALRRIAHSDYMLDQGVAFLHGLDRPAAAWLAADKEP